MNQPRLYNYFFVKIFKVHKEETKDDGNSHKVGKSRYDRLVMTSSFVCSSYTIMTLVPAVATKPTKPIRFSPNHANKLTV